MYSFNVHELGALRGLPTQAARIAIQRWVELTYDQTHPEWRWHLMQPPIEGAEDRLVQAIEDDASLLALQEVEHVSTLMLREGGSRTWQNYSVRGFLLDPKGAWAGTSYEPFLTRLKIYTGLQEPDSEQTPDVSEEPGDQSTEEEKQAFVNLHWDITPALSKGSKLPWTVRRLAANDSEKPDITIAGRLVEDGKAFTIHSVTNVDGPRNISTLAAYLRAHGSTLIDLLRLTYPNLSLQTSRSLRIEGSTRLSKLEPSSFPRLQSERAKSVLKPLLELANSNPTSETTGRLLSATHWISTAAMRWHENSASATASLWMALESMYGKCIWGHEKKCKREHPSAIELYVANIDRILASEIEEYMLAQRGAAYHRAKGWRRPPEWLSARPTGITREGRPIKAWLKDLIEQMAPEAWKDPLLQFRCNDLLYMGKARLERLQEERRRDLLELYKARNALVHEGSPILAEDKSIYLAALAIEILLIGFENPQVLHSK
jgi:hypothetical protein